MAIPWGYVTSLWPLHLPVHISCVRSCWHRARSCSPALAQSQGQSMASPPSSWQPRFCPQPPLQQHPLTMLCLAAGMKMRYMMMLSLLSWPGEAQAFCCLLCPSCLCVPAPEEVSTAGAWMLFGVGPAAPRAARPQRAVGSSRVCAEPAAPPHSRAVASSCKWAREALIPPHVGANSGFGPRRRELLLLFVSCFGKCFHLTAASWQPLSLGLVLQVEMLAEPPTGLPCWQLRRGNGAFLLFLRVPKWPGLLAALTKLLL